MSEPFDIAPEDEGDDREAAAGAELPLEVLEELESLLAEEQGEDEPDSEPA